MLNDTDSAILALAGAYYRHPEVRMRHAGEELGLTATQFWQRLNHIIDTPAALAQNVLLVNRLRARRTTRNNG